MSELCSDDDPNILTDDELGAFLRAGEQAIPNHHAPIRTLADTGMRFGEASALRWDDINEASGVIRVQRAQWRGRLGTTKTDRTPTVSLNDGLAKVLAEHRRRLLAAQAPGLADGWVFPSAKGTLLMGPSLRVPFEKALSAAKITKRFSIHGLRRTFNNLVHRVASGDVVRSMTGHVTERMTSHYSHVDAAEKRVAVAQALGHLRPQVG